MSEPSEHQEELRKRLWNDEQGQSNPSELFKQYKLYVGTTDEISNRRMQANKFFLTLNTAALAGLGTFFVYFAMQSALLTSVVIGLASLVGILMCLVWRRQINAYSTVNRAKFEVIGEMEKRLAASPLYAAEWYLLGPGGPYHHKSLTKNELLVPNAMIVFYLFVAVVAAIAWQWDQLLSMAQQFLSRM